MSRGKKPNVAQRNSLKKKVKEEWEDYLYISTIMKEPHNDSKHLSRDSVKEKYYIFKHKVTGKEIEVRARK